MTHPLYLQEGFVCDSIFLYSPGPTPSVLFGLPWLMEAKIRGGRRGRRGGRDGKRGKKGRKVIIYESIEITFFYQR